MLRRLLQRGSRSKHAVTRTCNFRKFSTTSSRNMRLVQFEYQGAQKVGIEVKNEGDIVNLTDSNKIFPDNMVTFLQGGYNLMTEAKKLVADKSHMIPRQALRLLSPVTGPEKIICMGMNYKDHCLEQNAPIPEEPIIFSKFASSIIGPGDAIVLPKVSDAVDWEVELAVVIASRGKNIERSEAMGYVAGYTVAHDVSARDWQMHKNGKQWLLGKTFDTFCPLGPALVTKDEIPDPHKLGVRCLVNNFTMQDSSTEELIFKIEDCIEWISRICELKPGDLILTGTPPGVGVFRKPPVYLKAGDTVTCEIDCIGKITNPVVDEQ